MIEIQNKKVTDWVAECAAMTKPKEIVWIDGSEAQLDAIRALASPETKREPSSVRLRRRTPVRPTIGYKRTKCMPK